MENGLSAAAAATSAIVVASAVVIASATVVAAISIVAAAAEEKDKDDDPPAAVIVSEHEISPREKKLYRRIFCFAGMLYDMKTFSRWLQKNRRNDWRIL